MGGGLEQTRDHWPEIRTAFGWVHRAADILGNADDVDEAAVRRRYRGLLGAMSRHRESAGNLRGAVDHFLKVTRSYWPGLFACYGIDLLPRTNNALEQSFGSHRFHERRCTGRKTASASMVVRGSVKIIAGAATRLRRFNGDELAPECVGRWRSIRQSLETRRQSRVRRTRFRRDPHAFLAQIEADYQRALPL